MERLIVQSTVALFLVFVLLPSQADCRANAGHGRRHHHGWNKLDNYESYVYKPNPRIICQESEEDIERVVEQAKQKCKCPIIYAPVCGSDNVTYQNRCILDCAANHKLKYQGHHRGKKLVVKEWGPCAGNSEESDDYDDDQR